jgi:hypothetical protein
VLNKRAQEALGLAGILGVNVSTPNIELAFDKDIYTIRLAPVQEGGTQVKKTSFYAKGFLTAHDIKLTGHFPAKLVDGCLYAYLGIGEAPEITPATATGNGQDQAGEDQAGENTINEFMEDILNIPAQDATDRAEPSEPAKPGTKTDKPASKRERNQQADKQEKPTSKRERKLA